MRRQNGARRARHVCHARDPVALRRRPNGEQERDPENGNGALVYKQVCMYIYIYTFMYTCDIGAYACRYIASTNKKHTLASVMVVLC